MLSCIINLFDQWNATTMFLKIDFRSNYYQLRVKGIELLKTTFRTLRMEREQASWDRFDRKIKEPMRT